MKSKTKTYVCGHCHGKGFREMKPEFTDILDLLRKSPATCGEIARALEVSEQNIMARLYRLQELKLIDRRYTSRAGHWFLVEMEP